MEYEAEDSLPRQKKVEESKEESKEEAPKIFFALIKLEKETLAQEQSLIIGSKLDSDTAIKQCRLSFYGQLLKLLPTSQNQAERQQFLQTIKITKDKSKLGKIDKVVD